MSKTWRVILLLARVFFLGDFFFFFQYFSFFSAVFVVRNRRSLFGNPTIIQPTTLKRPLNDAKLDTDRMNIALIDFFF